MEEKKNLLGIIGGMGTQATACFYKVLHDLQSVASEQEYLDVLLYSMPSIPDRTAYITGQSGDSPLKHLIHAARTLEHAGSSCIVFPCATSHFFYADLVKAVNIPVLNMLDETACYTKECGFMKVFLLATDGTLKGSSFHKAFGRQAIEVMVPQDGMQADLMDIIYDIKRGAVVSADILDPIIAEAFAAGADAVVLGCTELCVFTGDSRDKTIRHSSIQNSAVINIIEVLAEASISFFKGTFK